MKSDLQTAAQHHLDNIADALQKKNRCPAGADPQDFTNLHNLSLLAVRAYHSAIDHGLRPSRSEVDDLKDYTESIARSTGTTYTGQLSKLVDFIKKKIPGALKAIS